MLKFLKKNINHYINFFKNINLKDIIKIEVEFHLEKQSNKKINVSCDICNIQRYIKYQAYTKNINSCKKYPIYTCDKCSHVKLIEYNRENYGVDYYSQHSDKNKKVKETCLNRYGVAHFSQTLDFKEKTAKTCLDKFGFVNPFMDKERIQKIFVEKYGVAHPSQIKEINNKIRKTNEDSGYWIPLSEKSEYQIYLCRVRVLTIKNFKILINNWNGYDYYDGEYIKDNFNLHHNDINYPTVDHKLSIHYGFINGLDPIIISGIDNLCFTKRSINSSKGKSPMI